MAKKQAQFRFEDTLYEDINNLAREEGITVTEVVRNALKLYLAVYKRTKAGKGRLLIETGGQNSEKCEVMLPWF